MEINKFKHVWIWFWYNDATRICIALGVHLAPIGLLLSLFGADGETIRDTLAVVYIVVLVWAFLDNDYSNLRKIGMDEYRRKL